MSPLGLREAREGDPGQAEPGGHAQPFVEGQSPWGPSSADRAGVQAGGEMERRSDWRLLQQQPVCGGEDGGDDGVIVFVVQA